MSDRLRSRRLDLADLTVLRYVPGTSWLHRRSATAKVLGLVILVISLAVSATWSTVGSTAALVAVGLVVARLPVGVAPRPPRVMWIGMALVLGISLLSGGDPTVAGVGLGGVLITLRLFAFTVTVLALAGLVGWTTPAADLTPAIATILRPLRRVRVPVDELIAALALAIRSLPLLLDEFRTLTAVWRLRPGRDRATLTDIGAAAVTNAVRRASELGDAVLARGGATPPATPTSWSWGDGVLLAAVLAVATTNVAL